jgi:carbon monoxide dehydrogenase subunit G
MEFENTFDVPAPIDEVYVALLDVQRVAPCVPGAEVLEQTGEDAYKVAIKVKVGPMSMTYKGDVEIVEKNEDAHRAVMRAKAREARGQGTVNSLVVMQLTGAEGRTTGEITTDVQLSGRVASMGRGIIQDVSARIVDQFSENLAAMLSGPEAPAAPAEAAAPAAAGGPAPSAAAPPPPPKPKPAAAAASELSATDVAGAVVMGRLKEPKGLVAALGIAALIGFLLGRRRG